MRKLIRMLAEQPLPNDEETLDSDTRLAVLARFTRATIDPLRGWTGVRAGDGVTLWGVPYGRWGVQQVVGPHRFENILAGRGSTAQWRYMMPHGKRRVLAALKGRIIDA